MVLSTAKMIFPRPSPALRGRLLLLVARLVEIRLFRDLLLRKVRKDSRIPELPEV